MGGDTLKQINRKMDINIKDNSLSEEERKILHKMIVTTQLVTDNLLWQKDYLQSIKAITVLVDEITSFLEKQDKYNPKVASVLVKNSIKLLAPFHEQKALHLWEKFCRHEPNERFEKQKWPGTE